MPSPEKFEKSFSEPESESKTYPQEEEQSSGLRRETGDGLKDETSKLEEDKYSPEAIRREISYKAEKIRAWAEQMGLEDGKDFLMVEDIKEVEQNEEEIAPHEGKALYVAIHENHYQQFRDYFLGQYKEERKEENPRGDAKLDYSWGGRFAVGWDGVPIDTVPASDIENLTVPTRHEEFRQFFYSKTGLEFPSAETLNPILEEMSKKGLNRYKEALKELEKMKEAETLPNDGYGLIDTLQHSIMILEDAKEGEAVVDLPESLHGEMPAKMRHYADLTYNAEDLRELGRVAEITGIEIPDDTRTDKIFESFGFNRENMEEICHDFSDHVLAKRELEESTESQKNN